jgi:hypothetical protein
MADGIELTYRVSRASDERATMVFDGDAPLEGTAIDDIAGLVSTHPYGSVEQFQEDVYRATAHLKPQSSYSLQRTLGYPALDGERFLAGALFKMRSPSRDYDPKAEAPKVAVLIPFAGGDGPVVVTKGTVGADDVRNILQDLYSSMSSRFN